MYKCLPMIIMIILITFSMDKPGVDIHVVERNKAIYIGREGGEGMRRREGGRKGGVGMCRREGGRDRSLYSNRTITCRKYA